MLLVIWLCIGCCYNPGDLNKPNFQKRILHNLNHKVVQEAIIVLKVKKTDIIKKVQTKAGQNVFVPVPGNSKNYGRKKCCQGPGNGLVQKMDQSKHE